MTTLGLKTFAGTAMALNKKPSIALSVNGLSVGFIEWMPSFAVSFPCVDSLDGLPAQGVRSDAHSFKAGRVYTTVISAEMVDDQTLRNHANYQVINESRGANTAAALVGAASKPEGWIPVLVMEASHWPVVSGFTDLNLSPETRLITQELLRHHGDYSECSGKGLLPSQ